jgi:curved DNA-binding protein CbpA
MDKDYYQTLNLNPGASYEEIKKSYRSLVKELHPDRRPADPESETRIKEINEAYEVLKDPEKRSRYDRNRAGGISGPEQGRRGYGHYAHDMHPCMKWMQAFQRDPGMIQRMAYQMYQRRHYRSAAALLEKAIELSPEESRLYRDLGDCLYWQGEHGGSAKALRKALDLHPHDLDSWFNLAYVQELSGDLKGARLTLQNGIEHFPGNREFQEKLARIAGKAGGK